MEEEEEEDGAREGRRVADLTRRRREWRRRREGDEAKREAEARRRVMGEWGGRKEKVSFLPLPRLFSKRRVGIGGRGGWGGKKALCNPVYCSGTGRQVRCLSLALPTWRVSSAKRKRRGLALICQIFCRLAPLNAIPTALVLLR